MNNATTFGNIKIPPQQDQPPAGFLHIAFRPDCTQLTPVLQQNGLVAWTLALPDGRVEILAEYPQMPETQAFSYLGSEGLCKVNGDPSVPIVLTAQLPQRPQIQPEIQPTSVGEGVGQNPVGASVGPVGYGSEGTPQESPTGGLMGLIGGSFLLAVIGYLAVGQMRKGPKSKQVDQSVSAPRPKLKTRATSYKQSEVSDLLGGK